MVGAFQRALKVSVGFDTDVNASVLGEVTFGQAKGMQTVLYYSGHRHWYWHLYQRYAASRYFASEAGHVLLSKHPEDKWECRCPYHPNCFEGLACGPAIEERWGKSAKELGDDPKVWEMEAYYIAQALMDYICVLARRKSF